MFRNGLLGLMVAAGLATPAWAGELDGERAGVPASAPTTITAGGDVLGVTAGSELDREAPAQANHFYGARFGGYYGGGYGGYGGYRGYYGGYPSYYGGYGYRGGYGYPAYYGGGFGGYGYGYRSFYGGGYGYGYHRGYRW
jgi:hypothetical protein